MLLVIFKFFKPKKNKVKFLIKKINQKKRIGKVIKD